MPINSTNDSDQKATLNAVLYVSGIYFIKNQNIIKMNEKELNENGFYIESYGGGFIIEFYMGNSAKYYGRDLIGQMQPVIPLHNIFTSKELALEACNKIKI
jgi:hypothetical protein